LRLKSRPIQIYYEVVIAFSIRTPRPLAAARGDRLGKKATGLKERL
jgi:hypothetical protein